MSGHSKWATIRRKKGALDAKRGKVFTKLIRELSTAARLGGPDPAGNARLRLVVDKARAANMPKDNIERAIKRGSGASEGEVYEEVVYEGYGPGGTAILLEALTDNRNRTASEVRHTLTKYSGSLGSTGCVSYLFEKRGQIGFEAGGFEGDALLEAALEAGAEDVQEHDGGFLVLTRAGQLHAVKEALERRGFRPADTSLTMAPSTTVKLVGRDAEAMLHLSDALEDLDDIQGVYANYDISEEEMAKLA